MTDVWNCQLLFTAYELRIVQTSWRQILKQTVFHFLHFAFLITELLRKGSILL